MKVSELIKLLEEMKEKYGDIDVEYYDDVYAWTPIEDVVHNDYSNWASPYKEFIGLN